VMGGWVIGSFSTRFGRGCCVFWFQANFILCTWSRGECFWEKKEIWGPSTNATVDWRLELLAVRNSRFFYATMVSLVGTMTDHIAHVMPCNLFWPFWLAIDTFSLSKNNSLSFLIGWWHIRQENISNFISVVVYSLEWLVRKMAVE